MDPGLHAAYDTCRRLHRRHDPTYYWATRRLPPEVRPATHALYGYVRTADEMVDGPSRPADPAQRRAALDAWEAELEGALRTGRSSNPVVAALVDAGRRHALPLHELRTYMRSMRVDCGPVRIGSHEELDAYMDGSAGTVGRIMAAILSIPEEHRETFGRLGQAFQLTNFIRDVREDRALDRVYLPADARAAFGVEEEELDQPRAGSALRALVAAEVERARALFDSCEHTVAAAPPRVRPGMRVALAVYRGVLDRVEAVGFDVLGRRTSPPPWQVAGATIGALRP